MKMLFRATALRRLALVLLLVVGGGMITIIPSHHEAPSRSVEPFRLTPAADAPSTGQVPAIDEPPASRAELTSASAPGLQYVPMRIQIPAIGASAPIDPLGLNRDGTLEVPTDFGRAGYYTGRPPPGAIGPAIVVAHVDSKSGPAVFARLRELKPGDEVTVTRTDRSEVVFVIDRLESHPKNAFPTTAVYAPTPGATLRLITCGGSFDRRARHYRDNVIAFARYRSLTPPQTRA